MSNSGGWYAQQARLNPDLFRVIFDFYRRPQFWLHPEVLDALPESVVVKALMNTKHGGSHLARWLNRTLSLDVHVPVWNFEEPRRRLNLLRPETLSSLARFAGAAMIWPSISSVIGKKQMQEVKGSFGEDAYAFALRRARFIVSDSDVAKPESGVPLYNYATELGWNMLSSAACDEAEPIQQRFLLKLPPAIAKKTMRRVPQEVRQTAWTRIRKISSEVLTEGEMKCFA